MCLFFTVSNTHRCREGKFPFPPGLSFPHGRRAWKFLSDFPPPPGVGHGNLLLTFLLLMGVGHGNLPPDFLPRQGFRARKSPSDFPLLQECRAWKSPPDFSTPQECRSRKFLPDFLLLTSVRHGNLPPHFPPREGYIACKSPP